jgi:hypothetical protein
MFSKDEMQQQLREFMGGFAQSVGRMYGGSRAGALVGYPDEDVLSLQPGVARVKSCRLWIVVAEMYDYGMRGLTHLQPSEATIDGDYADVELFLNGLTSLEEYMAEDAVVFPTLARRAMRTAIARLVLEGAERYTGSDEQLLGALSFAELALLADMDERSVRNAASGANPSLRSGAVGKRSVVPIEEARRWLAGRKGFVPTTVVGRAGVLEAPATIVVRSSTADQIHKLALAAGLTVNQFLANLIEERSHAQ